MTARNGWAEHLRRTRQPGYGPTAEVLEMCARWFRLVSVLHRQDTERARRPAVPLFRDTLADGPAGSGGFTWNPKGAKR